MEPAKRPKLDITSSAPSTSIFNSLFHIEQIADIFRLNDDCFEAIFIWLCVDDLSALSETCVRIKNLVQVYFVRKYPRKRSEIARLNGIITINKYAGLKEAIPNIWFRGTNVFEQKPRDSRRFWPENMRNDDFDLLIYYLRSQCNKRPKSIRFENMILLEKEGFIMDGILKSIDAVEFINCEAQDIYNHILVRCKQLKSLTLRLCSNPSGEDEVETWLMQRYPSLECLDMQLSASSSHELLDTFFELNPQIKRFACRSRLSSFRSKIQHVMKAITERALQLEELSLTIGGDCDFRNVFSQLLTISERQQLKLLHLEFRNADVKDMLIDNLNNLACLNKLHTLQINNVDFAEDLPNNIDALVSLKELHLNNSANCEYSARIMSTVVPNLELLVIRNSSYFTPSVVDFIQPFIENLPKLKKIVMAHDVYVRINLRLAHLNEQRQKLKNACALNIWLYPPKKRVKHEPKIVEKTLIRLQMLTDEYEHF